MDWKRYYRNECAAPGARETLERWVRTADDTSLVAAVERGAVLSFPHTALAYAGPLQARVVRGLLDAGVDRILALGVLHSGSLEVYRAALGEGGALDRRAEAFRAVSGAFFTEESEARTPLGAVPLWRPLGARGTLRADRHGLLDAEFSLDTFLTACRAGADAFGRRPIPVLAAYVGMTRDPASGSFSVAEDLGDWVRSEHAAGTAVVTTGDLVHYGTGYGEAWGPGGADRPTLSAALRAEVERCLGAALRDGDRSRAYALSRGRLLNDQREILPVLATTLGVPASHALLSFELSDYAPILRVAPPCFVASALARYGE
ncbi:MAG: hypothetical protein PHX77_01730 [Candidatus Bipolaricaulis sp.]|nr:hypothetical protein [Candidatus Bipolaricaulis sp.]